MKNVTIHIVAAHFSGCDLSSSQVIFNVYLHNTVSSLTFYHS